MELKSYQVNVLHDIEEFIRLLSENGSISESYNRLWDSKGYTVRTGGVPPYRNNFPGVPDVCMKVPTGGGKTFIACAALKKIYENMPRKNKMVIWLVPSSAILEQTKTALKDPSHPYRQRINADFSGAVGIYDIEDLLGGKNFSPQVIEEQLTICVLSYSSMRTNTLDNRRMYRQNSSLYPFMDLIDEHQEKLGEQPTLMGVINALKPVIVLDESHNAGSTLTKKALVSMDPSFVLELTATPKKDSNIISIVTAGMLKKENMVKIPLIVYARPDVEHVLYTTMDYRGTLEEAARSEREKTGRYVRPIALIQAQPKNDDDSVTFEHIKKLLVKSGIAEEQIAIKTSTKDELKNIDLSSPNCEIRYIITVNALKEGWDCPFAYILSTIASRSSETEVEQIIGRVLRQPGASKFEDQILNYSYVITSSKVFHETLKEVSKGLLTVGFSEKDYRIGEKTSLETYFPGSTGAPVNTGETVGEGENEGTVSEGGTQDGPDNKEPFDPEKIRKLKEEGEEGENKGPDDKIDPGDVRKAGERKENEGGDEEGGDYTNFNRQVKMKAEFTEDATSLRIPLFMYRESSMYEDFCAPVSNESLTKGFELSKEDRNIDYSLTNIEAGKWELRNNDDILKYTALSKEELDRQRARFREMEIKDESGIRGLKKDIKSMINRRDDILDKELDRYLDLLIDDMSLEVLNDARRNTKEFVSRINTKIDALAKSYRIRKFDEKCSLSEIVCDPSKRNGYYTFPKKIDPRDDTKKSIPYAKSLYERCQGVTGLEERILHIIDGSDNVLWWHRVVASVNGEFYLNGPIRHYPDFIAKTRTGVTVLIEAKGSQLDNPDTELKIKMGKTWERMAGPAFKYFMVFERNEDKAEGSISAEMLKDYLDRLRL